MKVVDGDKKSRKGLVRKGTRSSHMVALLRKSISLSKVKKGAKQRQSYRRRREIWPLTKSVSLKSNLRFQLTRHLMIYYIKNKKKIVVNLMECYK